jgi:hypothetical protein
MEDIRLSRCSLLELAGIFQQPCDGACRRNAGAPLSARAPPALAFNLCIARALPASLPFLLILRF